MHSLCLSKHPFAYITKLIPPLNLSTKPLILQFTLSIPRLITVPLVSLLSNSPLHSLSSPLILSLVCLINLSSHSVTHSHIHMRHTRPAIDTIKLRMRDGKWKWPICTFFLFYRPVKWVYFFLQFQSQDSFFFPHPLPLFPFMPFLCYSKTSPPAPLYLGLVPTYNPPPFEFQCSWIVYCSHLLSPLVFPLSFRPHNYVPWSPSPTRGNVIMD